MSEIVYEKNPAALPRDAVLALYEGLGWTTYTRDPDKLMRAIQGSHHVVAAWDGQTLIGLTRCVSDGETIAYIQDILVAESHQRRGIGRRMLTRSLDHYGDIRQKVLLTDDRPEQRAFYTSLGFSNTRELVRTPLNAFVRFEGVELG